ncbi:phage tail tape measure protein [Companilactobacillus bobalius]|uniref:Phage-related tail protein n=2 Tax=Companilactobacillus bobalius TaxID=2801451 RepID=A0A0R1KLX8_9LACO|nr:phage tail tape measure protein [Companilactobacillus bobalius]KRK84542.1 phage-related tail protein [Companilactobacillus bobalius DSM 19674]OVE94974.1 putative tape measure protein [Companilactobacillus bobalius]GEO59577.1 phage tail tape measure protein [Companilactobacillus paralimentarius]
MAKDMELNTGIHIDSIQAEGSLQSLRNQVKALTSEWKINEQVQRANGDYQSAYQAKAEGLGRAIEGQTNYLNRLKSEMSNLDRTTTEGSQKFSQYTNQVNTATRQLNNMVMQQERAKSTLNLYTTGIKDQKQAMENAKNISQSLVERYKAEGKEIKASATERTALKARIQELNSLYSKESSELERVKKESGETSKEYATQTKRVNELGTEIAKSRTRYRELGSELGGMGTHFTGIRQAAATSKTAIGNMNSSIKNSISHMKNMAMTAGIAGAAVTAMFVSGAKKSVELENSYKQITNLAETGGEKVAEATKNVSRMQEDGQKYALKYGKSQQEIADGYEDLIKRGYDTKQALGAMKSELQASVASGDDFKDVVKVSSQTLEAFGMKTTSTSGMIKNTKKVVNDLAYAADMTATGFSDLGVGMSYVGSTAHQAGFSLSETSSAMGILSNNGLEADKAGTGLRKVINSLISPTKTGASALQELGLSTKDFTDNKGNMKSMTDIFGLLHDKMQGMGKNKQTDIFHNLFGTTGQQAGLILADNAKQLGELNQKVADSAKNDYVGKLAKKNSETGKVALDRLKQSVNAITMTISSAALPAITEIGDKLAKAAGTKEFGNAVKGVGKWVGNLTDKVADFFTYLGKHSNDLKGITGSLGTIVKDIAVGAWDTFYGIIKGIGKAFGLVHTNGKKAEDPLKVLNEFVSGIAKHEQALKTIGGLLAGIWVADKVANFAVKINDVADAFGGLSKKLKNSGIQNAASEIGEQSGENLAKGIESKAESSSISSRLNALGGSMMGKISIGMSVVQVGFDVIGAIKAKNPTDKAKNIGGGIGSALGAGIAGILLGPEAAVLGAQLGDLIGKNVGPGISNYLDHGNTSPKGSKSDIKKRLKEAQDQYKANKREYNWFHSSVSKDALDQNDKDIKRYEQQLKRIENDKKKPKTTSTAKAIKDVATTHVSKTDIKNVKDMVPAIKDYEKAIKSLKLNLKNNSPSKELSKIDKSIQGKSKEWKNMVKPVNNVAGAFKKLSSSTKFMKKDPFSELNSDLKKLKKTLKDSNITDKLDSMAKDLKKHKLASELKTVASSIKDNTKTWTKFAKPIRDVQKAFQELNKFTKTYSKSDPFANLDKDIQNLTKTLNNQNIGKILKSQITEANKATSNVTFDKDFKTDTDNVVDALKSFKINFDKSWKDVWANTGSEEKDALAKVVSNYSSKMNSISKKETSFSSDYLNKWSSWLKSVTSSFKTAFNSLPGLASKSLSKVISEVNKGIGGVNSVITDFGGKSLNLAKYAVGTAGTPGGNLAVVGEQGYELAYDKANGIYPVGLKGEEVRYLGADTAILPHHLSEQFMGMVANLPHHATGKGDTNKTSEDMTDYVFEHLDELKKDPVPFLKKPYFEKANFNGNEFISRFGNAISNGFLKAIAEPFKKTLADMDFSGAGGARPVKAYGPMIKAAAAYMHQQITDFNVDMIERIIANESGGDPNVTNNWDDNAKAGHPSTGILQYILPTFLNYAMPGHTNIHNPLDQLIALFNDSTWRTDMGMGYNGKFGEWRGQASGPSGPRFMYDGGFITKPTSIIGGDAGPEVMIPLNNKMRAIQILQKAKDTIGGPDDNNVTTSVDTARVESNQQQQLMMTQVMVKLLSKIADGSMASDVSNGGISLNDISNALDKIGLSNRKMTKFQGKGGTAFA